MQYEKLGPGKFSDSVQAYLHNLTMDGADASAESDGSNYYLLHLTPEEQGELREAGHGYETAKAVIVSEDGQGFVTVEVYPSDAAGEQAFESYKGQGGGTKEPDEPHPPVGDEESDDQPMPPDEEEADDLPPPPEEDDYELHPDLPPPPEDSAPPPVDDRSERLMNVLKTLHDKIVQAMNFRRAGNVTKAVQLEEIVNRMIQDARSEGYGAQAEDVELLTHSGDQWPEIEADLRDVLGMNPPSPDPEFDDQGGEWEKRLQAPPANNVESKTESKTCRVCGEAAIEGRSVCRKHIRSLTKPNRKKSDAPTCQNCGGPAPSKLKGGPIEGAKRLCPGCRDAQNRWGSDKTEAKLKALPPPAAPLAPEFTVVRKPYPHQSQCSRCGYEGRVYTYGHDTEGHGTKWLPGKFCGKSCYYGYHDAQPGAPMAGKFEAMDPKHIRKLAKSARRQAKESGKTYYVVKHASGEEYSVVDDDAKNDLRGHKVIHTMKPESIDPTSPAFRARVALRLAAAGVPPKKIMEDLFGDGPDIGQQNQQSLYMVIQPNDKVTVAGPDGQPMAAVAITKTQDGSGWVLDVQGSQGLASKETVVSVDSPVADIDQSFGPEDPFGGEDDLEPEPLDDEPTDDEFGAGPTELDVEEPDESEPDEEEA